MPERKHCRAGKDALRLNQRSVVRLSSAIRIDNLMADEANTSTLSTMFPSTEENTSVSFGLPRMVVEVSPRPCRAFEEFLSIVRPLFNHQYSYPGDTVCILSDYELLLSEHEQGSCAEIIFDTAAALLTLGADPRNTSLCRESDIGYLPEVYWLLSCVLRLPEREEHPFPAAKWRAEKNGSDRSLFLAAIAICLGVTRLVLDSGKSGEDPSFVPLLREIERRLHRESYSIQVLRPPISDWLPGQELPLDLCRAKERYRSFRHDLVFLRDVLNEGALVASQIISPAIAGLREYLHLNDGSAGHP